MMPKATRRGGAEEIKRTSKEKYLNTTVFYRLLGKSLAHPTLLEVARRLCSPATSVLPFHVPKEAAGVSLHSIIRCANSSARARTAGPAPAYVRPRRWLIIKAHVLPLVLSRADGAVESVASAAGQSREGDQFVLLVGDPLGEECLREFAGIDLADRMTVQLDALHGNAVA